MLAPEAGLAVHLLVLSEIFRMFSRIVHLD